MLITNPKELERFYAKNRMWQGIPGIERTKNGRFFVTFYSGGTTEELGNFAAVLKSDDGVNFSEPVAAAYNGQDYRCYDSCLWIDPLSRLWFIWAVSPEHAVYASICENPDADILIWSDEFKIGNDVMMNKPTVLSTGEWLFPIAVWSHNLAVGQLFSKDENRGPFVYQSIDNGKTFEKLGCPEVPLRHIDEHMILEMNDGNLSMFVRTKYGIGVSYSYDKGKTWSEGTDSKLGGPCSRFFIRRLKSGRILLVNHYDYTGRNNLTAMLSDDECKTWKYKLLLDERTHVSYPDAAFDGDGYIYIIYDRERGVSHEQIMQSAKEILMAKITEEDIINGSLVNKGSELKIIVNKLGKYEGMTKNENESCEKIRQYSDEEYINLVSKYNSAKKIINLTFSKYSVECQNLHKLNINSLDKLIRELYCLELPDFYSVKEILLDIIKLLKAAETDKNVSEKPIVNNIMDFIRKNNNEHIRISDIADIMNVNIYYMCYIFKQKTGTSIIDYRNKLKLSAAKKHLMNTNDPIYIIAEKCGFNDANYFSRVFKKSEGVTPNEYRLSKKLINIEKERAPK